MLIIASQLLDNYMIITIFVRLLNLTISMTIAKYFSKESMEERMNY